MIQESQPKHNSVNAIGMEGNRKKKICFNFHEKGTCRHDRCGNECKRGHEKGGKSNRLCKCIREGKCKWGKRCRFSHEPGDEATNSSKIAVDASFPKIIPSSDPSANTSNGDWRESCEDVVQTVDNDVAELAQVNIPQVNIASKPCNANESSRHCDVLRVFVEGKSGPAEMKALLDDGSQPTTISLQKIKLLGKLGAKMKRTKMSGQVGGLSATCVRMEGEVEFEMRVKCKTARGGHVRLRIFATVLDGNANFDFTIGQDVRNLHRIVSHPDPKPEHRKVTIDGTPVCSHPCTSHHQNANSLTLESNLLASPASAQDAGITDGERSKTERLSNSCSVHETLDLLDAADSRSRECDHVCGTGVPDEEIEHSLGEIVSLQHVHRESERGNAELASGDCLRVLNRAEEEFRAGSTLMTSREQFHCLRRVLCRCSSRFVENTPETGELRMPKHEVHDHLSPGKKFMHQKAHRLPPDRLNAMETKLEELEKHGSCHKKCRMKKK
eukprot:jgi/Bigna1/137027/aug1.37_g11735